MRPAWKHDIYQYRRRKEPGVLTGVRKICKYMAMSSPTFYKLVRGHGLPAMRLPGGRWCTTKNLIDDWVLARWKKQKLARGPAEADDPTGGQGKTEAGWGRY